MQVVIGYSYIVANGSSRYFSIQTQGVFCRNVTLRLLNEMHKPLTCRQMWANFMRDKLVFGWTEQQSQNLLLKVDPVSTIRNNKLNTQGEKLETVKLRVFVSNISSLPSVKSAIYEIQLFDLTKCPKCMLFTLRDQIIFV